MGSHRRFILTLLAAAALAAPMVPAHAGSIPCAVRDEAVATAQYKSSEPIGLGPSCVPGLNCENLGGCVFTVKISISGYGLLGGVIQGPFKEVTCGPLPLTCTAKSPDFAVPFGGLAVKCASAITLAVHVQLVCSPQQLR
jgi:hypothetical protein